MCQTVTRSSPQIITILAHLDPWHGHSRDLRIRHKAKCIALSSSLVHKCKRRVLREHKVRAQRIDQHEHQPVKGRLGGWEAMVRYSVVRQRRLDRKVPDEEYQQCANLCLIYSVQYGMSHDGCKRRLQKTLPTCTAITHARTRHDPLAQTMLAAAKAKEAVWANQDP